MMRVCLIDLFVPCRALEERYLQLRQERLGVLQIARVEALREPGVERGEEGASSILALVFQIVHRTVNFSRWPALFSLSTLAC